MSIFDIGINDTLQDVIRKANYNFRQISSSRMSATGSSGTDADISGLIEDLEEEVRNRISADEQINDTIDGMFDSSGKLSSSIMPSYVDDVIEAYPRSGATELSSDWLSLTSDGSALEPEISKIYILLSNSVNYQVNAMFRWTGTTYVKLSGNGASSDIYPTFIIPTWSESSDPATLPMTPCFVFNPTNSTYYYCDSTTITNLNSVKRHLNIFGENNFASVMFKSTNRFADAIRFFGGADEYGDAVVIGDGGMVIIGGGESAYAWYQRILGTDDPVYKSVTPGSEYTFITADGAVNIVSNGNTIANRKLWIFDNNGLIDAPGAAKFAGGRAIGSGDDEGIVIGYANNNYAGLCLGTPTGRRSVFYLQNNTATPFWRYNNGKTTYDARHPGASGTLQLQSSSDRRLKTDVEELSDEAIEFVKNLKPYCYTINGERQVGFMAQDVSELDPWETEMAFEVPDEEAADWEKMEDGSPVWRLDYVRIIPPMLKVLQDAMDRIEELEQEVAELKA